MNPTKAPSVDGFAALFFQQYWNLVGESVTTSSLKILNDSGSMIEINNTRILLIPKVKDPNNMSHFHPISLCNVFYKIIVKVHSNRLKHFRPKIISQNQSAFVPNHHITDNVMVAYEISHYP